MLDRQERNEITSWGFYFKRREFCIGRLFLFLFTLNFLCFSHVHAQQEGYQLTQFMFTNPAYNAGCMGMSNGIQATLLHRQQWLGWGKTTDENGKSSSISPNSTLLMADMPIKAIKGAVGLEIASYNAAQFNDVIVKLGYAYHLQTSFGLIGMGVRGHLESRALDFSKLDPEDSSDPILSGKQKENAMYGDVSVGFYLKGFANYFVGIGINNLIAHGNERINYTPTRNIAVNGGYTFSFPSAPSFELTPTAYFETDFTTINWSIAAIGTFRKKFWAGLSYRFQDAVSIMGGVNISKFKIGAAYDITASRLIKASSIGGSFEIFVSYSFGLEGEKVNTEYKNARYL